MHICYYLGMEKLTHRVPILMSTKLLSEVAREANKLEISRAEFVRRATVQALAAGKETRR